MRLPTRNTVFSLLFIAVLLGVVLWLFIGCSALNNAADTAADGITLVADTDGDGVVSDAEASVATASALDLAGPFIPEWLRALLEVGGTAGLVAFLRWRGKAHAKSAIADERDTDEVLKEKFKL